MANYISNTFHIFSQFYIVIDGGFPEKRHGVLRQKLKKNVAIYMISTTLVVSN